MIFSNEGSDNSITLIRQSSFDGQSDDGNTFTSFFSIYTNVKSFYFNEPKKFLQNQ